MILPVVVLLCCLGVGVAVTVFIFAIVDTRRGLREHREYIQKRDLRWEAEIITRLQRIEAKRP